MEEQPSIRLPNLGRRLLNIAAMGTGWCCALSGMIVNISTTSLAAAAWTGNTSFATLPVGMQAVASALSVARLAQRFGRRVVFVCAAVLAMCGASLMIAATYHETVSLLVIGGFLQGPSFAVAQNFRFVSAEFVSGPGYPPEWRTRAISASVGCAVFAAALGPEAVRHVRNGLPHPYMGAYVLLMGIYLLQALVTGCASYRWLEKVQAEQAAVLVVAISPTDSTSPDKAVSIEDVEALKLGDKAGPEGEDAPGRSASGPKDLQAVAAGLQQPNPPATPSVPTAPTGGDRGPHFVRDSLLSPDFWLPAVCGALSFCTMAGVMSPTPVAMNKDGLSYDMSTLTIEAHIVAMFAPGVLVGDTIAGIAGLARAASPLLRHMLLLLPVRPPSQPSPKAGPAPGDPFPASSPTTSLMVWGSGVLIASNVVCLVGRSLTHYMVGLVLLGLGWAWVYVSASSLVAAIFVKEPRLRVAVQGGMDTLVVGASACANTLSGTLSRVMGWSGFLILNLAFNGVLLALCAAYHLRRVACWQQRQGQ